jgi:hypothetical protein
MAGGVPPVGRRGRDEPWRLSSDTGQPWFRVGNVFETSWNAPPARLNGRGHRRGGGAQWSVDGDDFVGRQHEPMHHRHRRSRRRVEQHRAILTMVSTCADR